MISFQRIWRYYGIVSPLKGGFSSTVVVRLFLPCLAPVMYLMSTLPRHGTLTIFGIMSGTWLLAQTSLFPLCEGVRFMRTDAHEAEFIDLKYVPISLDTLLYYPDWNSPLNFILMPVYSMVSVSRLTLSGLGEGGGGRVAQRPGSPNSQLPI